MRPQPLQSLSVDRLINMEFNLTIAKNEDKENVITKLIDVQKALYSKLKKDRGNEYYSSLDKIKSDLIFNLVHYGSYLKMEYRKDDYIAEQTLRQVLMYDHKNPIAHYRLRFLNYKGRNNHLAIVNFQNTLQSHQDYHKTSHNIKT